MRTRFSIDQDWRFKLGDSFGALKAEFDDSDWRILDVPHDWSVEATPHPQNPAGASGGYFPGGTGWYRKLLKVPADLGDQRMLIAFDGVYMNSEVWCNGNFVGARPYGYSSFCYDLTAYVTPGENAVVAVRVDNSRQKNSRWYTGSGIYRHVWLTMVNPVRVDHWGTYVTTPEVNQEQAEVVCRTTIKNDLPVDADVKLQSAVMTSGGDTVASAETTGNIPAAGCCRELETRMHVRQPTLWSPDHPERYVLRTTVYAGGDVVDVYDTPFGIRSIRFDADTGFFLNGKSLKMQGVNEHHDAGCLGAAVPDAVLRRRFRILKEMGCNAIRVAHNPASPIFLDLCDEMGFLVVEDAFDEWREGKVPFGYQLYWDQWWEKDLVDMIRRDRNHPCVVLWSVGNEIIEVRQGRADGLPIMRALRDVCHREDPTRPMTCGCCNTRETLAAGYGPLMDVMGYNGGGGGCFDYEKDHANYPDMIMFASEVPHTLQTRGVYRTQTWYRDLARNPNVERLEVPHYTEAEVFEGFDSHYQSSYDNAMVRISAIDSWRFTETLPFMCGEFRWTGFDYLGECYSWPAKSWNFGVIDLCGYPKDTYYFYQSQWRETPMVHSLPHWTWPGREGQTIPVIVYSNCDAVELFLNGISLGVQGVDKDAMQLRWDVVYQPGTLETIGRNEGVEVARCRYATAGAAAAIEVCCPESSLRADGTDVAHVDVRVVDANGHVVPDASVEFRVDVSGSGNLIGLENGDPIDVTNYKINSRRTFNGMALAIVQAGREAGNLQVQVSAEGLASGCVTIPVA